MIQRLFYILPFLFLFSCDNFSEDKIDIATEENPIIVTDENIVAAQGKPLAIDLLGNDKIYTAATVSIKETPKKGTAEILDAGILLYIPNVSFTSGSDNIVYQICPDGNGDCVEGTVTIQISNNNDVPSCENSNSYFTYVAKNSVKTINLLQQEVYVNGEITTEEIEICNQEISTNSFEIVESPKFGSLQISSEGTASYTPHQDFIGDDRAIVSFSMESDTPEKVYYSLISMTVYENQICEIFLLKEDVLSLYEEVEVNNIYEIDALSNDIFCEEETDITSLYIITSPNFGTVIINNENILEYKVTTLPTEDTDTFKYQFCQQNGNCEEATVTIRFESGVRNECEPIAYYDYYYAFLNDFGADTTSFYLDMLWNDIVCADNPAEGLLISITSEPTYGTAEIQGEFIHYTRPDGFLGTTTMSYQICNEDSSSCSQAVIDILFLE